MTTHVCSKCMAKVVALVKAMVDLAELKRSAVSGMQQVQRSLKRTKETTGDVGVSPNTQRARPRSKIPRRLNFTGMSNINDVVQVQQIML